MTVSVGSYHDLQPDRNQPIDRNPSIECDICGESYNWQDYWKGRLTLGDPRTNKTHCDGCLARASRMHDRLTKNKKITEWCE